MDRELVLLDFIEHDSIAALKFLISKFEKNEASGMVFALRLKNRGSSQCFTGATGTLATNVFEGAGVASLLHLHMAQHASDN